MGESGSEYISCATALAALSFVVSTYVLFSRGSTIRTVFSEGEELLCAGAGVSDGPSDTCSATTTLEDNRLRMPRWTVGGWMADGGAEEGTRGAVVGNSEASTVLCAVGWIVSLWSESTCVEGIEGLEVGAVGGGG